jgi:hypothetical protein
MKDKEEEAEGDLGNSRTFVLEEYGARGARPGQEEEEASPRSKVLGLGACNAWLWQ